MISEAVLHWEMFTPTYISEHFNPSIQSLVGSIFRRQVFKFSNHVLGKG